MSATEMSLIEPKSAAEKKLPPKDGVGVRDPYPSSETGVVDRELRERMLKVSSMSEMTLS